MALSWIVGHMSESALTALLVDDEAYFRRFVGQFLINRQSFSRVVEAKDGREATDLYLATKPDVVILDINMPRMDGIETLQALRRQSADVPIVMLTSIADEMMVEKCVEEGASYFIRKDVPAQQLTQELGELLTEMLGQPPASP